MKSFQEVYASLPTKGWLSEKEAELLHRLASETEGPILEVGCYHGRSTVLMASLGRLMICVDPFSGFDSTDMTGEKALASFVSRVCCEFPNVHLHVKKVEEWRPERWPQIGLAYLDGDHTSEGTKAQIKAALACHAKVIAIHDVNDGGEGAAIRDAAIELLGPWNERVERLAIWKR